MTSQPMPELLRPVLSSHATKESSWFASQQTSTGTNSWLQGMPVHVAGFSNHTATVAANPCKPLQGSSMLRFREFCSKLLGWCSPLVHMGSCNAAEPLPAHCPSAMPAPLCTDITIQGDRVQTRLLRAQAVLDELPMMATLMQLDGKVLFQNEASIQYWGCLVQQADLPATATWREPRVQEHSKRSHSRCVLEALLGSDPELLEDLVSEVLNDYVWRKVLAVPSFPLRAATVSTVDTTAQGTAAQQGRLPALTEGSEPGSQATTGGGNACSPTALSPAPCRKVSRTVSFHSHVQSTDSQSGFMAPFDNQGNADPDVLPLPGLAETGVLHTSMEGMQGQETKASGQPNSILGCNIMPGSRPGTQGSGKNTAAVQLARTRSKVFNRDTSCQLPVAPSGASLTGADRRSRGHSLASAGLAFEPSSKVMSLISKASTTTATTAQATSAGTDGDGTDHSPRPILSPSRRALPPPPGLIAASLSQPGPDERSSKQLSQQNTAAVVIGNKRSSAPPISAAQGSVSSGPCTLADLVALSADATAKILDTEQHPNSKAFVHMASYLSAQRKCDSLGMDDAHGDILEAVVLPAGEQSDVESAHVSDASCFSRRFTSDGGVEGQGPLAELAPIPADVCWHEVEALPLTDPVGEGTNNKLLLLLQTDISGRAQLEASMAALTESQLTMLEQMFPRHVLEFMVDPQQTPLQQQANGLPLSTTDMNHLARDHTGVTILFTDIVGFTSMSKEVEPAQVMRYLNDLFTRFDCLVDTHGCYKVETAGDCYVAAGGLMQFDEEGFTTLDPRPDSQQGARRMLSFALALLDAARKVSMPHNGQPTTIRVGLHTGNVVTGLIGTKLPKFSLFGDAMNTASRMESTCPHMCIQASGATYALLDDAASGFQPTGGVEVKGKGKMETYVLDPATLPSKGAPLTAQSNPVGSSKRRSSSKVFSSALAVPTARTPAAARRNSETAAIRRNSGDILTALRSSAHCLFVTAPASPPIHQHHAEHAHSRGSSSPGFAGPSRRDLTSQPMNLRSSMQNALSGAGAAALLHITGQETAATTAAPSSGNSSTPLHMSGWKSGAASRGPSEGGMAATSHTVLPGALVPVGTSELVEVEPGRVSRSSTLSAGSRTSRVSNANARRNNHPLLSLLRARVHNSGAPSTYAQHLPAAGNSGPQPGAIQDSITAHVVTTAAFPDATGFSTNAANPFHAQPLGQLQPEATAAGSAHHAPKRTVTFGRYDMPWSSSRRPSEGPASCTVAAVAALAGSATLMLAQRPSLQSSHSSSMRIRASATNN